MLLKNKKSRRKFLFFDFFVYICIVTKAKEFNVITRKINKVLNQKKNSELWENVL